MSYYTKITTAGLAAITAAMNNSSKVPITYMAFGDGNGYIPEPDENATSLVNEVYRVGVNKVEVHSKNPNWLVCEAIIPSAVGGFNIREVALYDSTGNTMLAIANYPPTYKPTIEEGAAKIQTIRIVLQVYNTGSFELIIDPDIVLATSQYVDDKNKEIIKLINSENIAENIAEQINIPIGDGIYRNVKDLYTVGSAYFRFSSRSELETWLGFNLSTLINVVDEAPIDTVILQKAMNTLSSVYLETGKAQVLKLKTGSTYFATGLMYKCGVDLISDGFAKLKKRPALDVTNESILKWWRILACDPSSFNTAAKVKHRCRIRNIEFDGNLWEMNWSYNTYSQEQGSSLLIQGASGSSAASADIRARFDIGNVSFIDSVSDGLHIVQNSDVLISGNISNKNCFRGGLVITGGNTLVVGGGISSENSRLDIEVDSVGYGSTKYTYIDLKNYYQDVNGLHGDFPGGCDLEVSNNGELIIENLHIFSQPTNMRMGLGNDKGKRFQISNSTLTFGPGTSTLNRIMNPIGGKLLDNVKIRLLNDGFISFFLNYQTYLTTEDFWFQDCTFEYVGSKTELPSRIFSFESQNSASTGYFILKDSDCSKAPYSYLVSSFTGSKIIFDNVKHSSTGGYVNRGAVSGYPCKIKFEKIHPESPPIKFINAPYAPISGDSCDFSYNVKIDNSLNIQPSGDLGIVTSNRTVFINEPPVSSIRTFKGDIFILKDKVDGKPYEWLATTTSATNSKFIAKSWIIGKFNTSDLPVLTEFDVGSQNFDITLNKLVTWNGSAWV